MHNGDSFPQELPLEGSEWDSVSQELWILPLQASPTCPWAPGSITPAHRVQKELEKARKVTQKENLELKSQRGERHTNSLPLGKLPGGVGGDLAAGEARGSEPEGISTRKILEALKEKDELTADLTSRKSPLLTSSRLEGTRK